MLPTQIISIPFTGSLDTKSSWPLVNASQFLELENAVFTKTGALKKRWGYEAMGTVVEGGVTRLGTLVGGATRGPELVAFENDEAFSYIPATDKWASRGNVTSVITSSQMVFAPTDEELYGATMARIGSVNAATWRQKVPAGGSTLWVATYDDEGRRIARHQVGSTFSADPLQKIIAFGRHFILLWRDGVELKYLKILASSPASLIGSGTSIVGELTATYGHFDAIVIQNVLFIAYNGDDASDAGVYYRRFDTDMSDIDGAFSAVDLDTAAEYGIGVFTDDNNGFHVIWGHNDTTEDVVMYTRFDGSLVPASTKCVPKSGITHTYLRYCNFTGYVPTGSTTATVLWTERVASTGVPTPYRVMKNTVTVAYSVGTATTLKRTAMLDSRPFEYAGNGYVVIGTGNATSFQPTYFLLDITNSMVVSKFSNLTGGGTRFARCGDWALSATGQYMFAHGQRGRAVSVDGTIRATTGVASTLIDFASYRRYQCAELDQSLVVGGGIVQSYDGVRFAEHGPLLFPEGGDAVPVGSGGSLTAGAYQYKMVYELVDNNGQVFYSAASQAIDVTTTVGTDSVTITFPVLHVTSDFDRVNLALYRTKVNEPVFFRVWSAAAGKTAGLVQTSGVDTVTATDTVADATVGGNEILYTTGGYLENISAPSCTCLVSYKGRAVIAGTPEPNRVWFSKLTYPGTAVGFNDQLTIDIDPDGGPITALGVLDDKLIVFKHSRCYVVQGNGPDDTGQGFDFFPQLLSADVGCSEPGSVAAVPGGLMFKSAKGIYTITSGLGVVYAGAAVEAYNSQTIVSATLIPDRDMVLFVAETGLSLAFDYSVNKWTTFTNHQGVWCGIDVTTNKLVLFRSSGRVQRQSDSLFTDAGNAIKLRVVTGWLAQGELLGWQRVQRLAILGEYKGRHDLRVRIGHDFLEPYTQEATIPVHTIITTTTYGSGTYGSTTPYGGTYPAERFAVQLKKQKCMAVRVSIEDVQTTGYNEGLVLSGIAFRVGAKPGFNKQSHDRKIGAA